MLEINSSDVVEITQIENTEGYDGHSLRAFSYWPDKFPFDELTPELSFKVKKDPLLDAIRSASKAPTFALTYQGTAATLVKNCGFTMEEAKRIEANYHELYEVSDKYVEKRLDQAMVDGYVEVAFGLRLRTPLLAQALKGVSNKGGAIAAEGRTAGNALGQSYGLLTNRAMNAFMKKVWAHPVMRTSIVPVAMIHDALYFMVKDDPRVVKWLNDNLIEEMQWQELPEIQHDEVKLGAELDVFWPDWSKALTIPNESSIPDIVKLCQNHIEELKEKA